MSNRIKLVQGDTRPTLVCTITDENTGDPVGLDGATVIMKFREVGSETVKDTLTGIVTNAATGQVIFNWTPTALDGEPGFYEGEISITFSDSTVQTVYDVIKFNLRKDF